MGIISAAARWYIPDAEGSPVRIGFFLFVAAVNPGSSGGMLLNLRGEVIGILTAIATQGGVNEGVAFAMPINTVLRVAEQLVQTGTAVKPYFGCKFDQNVSAEDRKKLGIDRLVGAKINSVAPGTPVEQAGLKVGDIVLMFGNIEVEDGFHIVHLIALSEIGKPVVLRVNRNGTMLDVKVTPAAQSSR
jgi:serine protease Do